MLVINFSHPLTAEQVADIETLAGTSIEGIHTVPVEINQAEPLEPQIVAIVNSVDLSAEDWQTRQLLINPPGFAPAAFVLLAEIHGRMGHFPTLIRLRPVSGPVTYYEVAALLDLQVIREQARHRRY
jgi:hypothetical protein